MKILSISASNFGSYKQLNFEFDEQGLCLIQGQTGSGKSTLCDLVPWALFGKTSKDGAADDVIAWSSEEPTSVKIYVDIPGAELTIFRSRSPNDLYYKFGSSTPQRGKDLNDTQKQINQLLGMTYETYMAGSYFHEFSKTASFFTTTAKNRRDICEQLIDLSMAKSLQTKASDNLKEVKTKASDLQRNIDRAEHSVDTIIKDIEDLSTYLADFDNIKQRRIDVVTNDMQSFDKARLAKIEETTSALAKHKLSLNSLLEEEMHLEAHLKDETCTKCGSYLDVGSRSQLTELQALIQYTKQQTSNLKKTLSEQMNKSNPYAAQLVSEQNRENNYSTAIEQRTKQLLEKKKALDAFVMNFHETTNQVLDLELLQNTLQTFRAKLITDVMSFIQDKTNSLLSDYFDGELKVIFDVNQADKLDVTIYKDGNECNFTQLSKGQRQLLKLTFGVSVMQAVSNHSGVSFNCLFFDEAMDGMSDTLKLKAYLLFQSLAVSYSSVFFVDHSSELKAIANKSFFVSIENGESKIEEA